MKKWNQQIKEARKLSGLTQHQAAEKAGIVPRQYQRIEAGTSFPAEKTLLAICEAFNCVVIFPEEN